jgi:hypothetical protein
MTRATFTIAIALLPSMTNMQIKDISKISRWHESREDILRIFAAEVQEG